MTEVSISSVSLVVMDFFLLSHDTFSTFASMSRNFRYYSSVVVELYLGELLFSFLSFMGVQQAEDGLHCTLLSGPSAVQHTHVRTGMEKSVSMCCRFDGVMVFLVSFEKRINAEKICGDLILLVNRLNKIR